MGKLLIAIVIVVLVWRLLQRARVDTPGPRQLPSEDILPCAWCGVNQPRSECVEHDGHLYCCPAHRDAAARRPVDAG